MDDRINWDFTKINVSQLRAIHRLRDRLRIVPAADCKGSAIGEFRDFVKTSILDGADHPFFDMALTARDSQLPDLLAEIERFEAEFTEAWIAEQGGRGRIEQTGQEIVRRASVWKRSMPWAVPDVATSAFIGESTTPSQVEIAADDIVTVGSQSQIAAYAKQNFGHRPAVRSIQIWIADQSLRARERGHLWEFSRSDLEILVNRPKKQAGERAKNPNKVSTKEKRKTGARNAKGKRKIDDNS